MLKRLSAALGLVFLLLSTPSGAFLRGSGTPVATPVITFGAPSASYIYPAASGAALTTVSATVSTGSFLGGGGTFSSSNCSSVDIAVASVGTVTVAGPSNLTGSQTCLITANYPGAISVTQTFTLTGTQQTIASISPCSLLAGCVYSFTPPATALTLGAVPAVSMSGGISFAAGGGTIALGVGAQCSDFAIVGGNLQITAASAGTYSCSYTITDANAQNSPQTVSISASSSISAITGINIQSTTFAANTPTVPVGAVMPFLTNGAPFTSAPFTGTLSIVTTGTDNNGTPCTTNGNGFQILAAKDQLAASTSSPPAAGSYPGVCVQASQPGYSSWIQAFTLTATSPPANQIVLTNVSGSNITNYKYQFGRPFVDGAIISGQCPVININGTPAAQSQFDIKKRFPDGSAQWGVGAVVIPSLINNVPTTLTFPSGACNNTALTQAQMLASGFNFEATETLKFPAAVLTGGPTHTSIAAWQAITSGGFNITINGTALNIVGLNFSASTSLAQVANVIQQALNTALGTTATQAVQVWNLGTPRNVNNQFVISVLGPGSSISAVTSPGSGTDISTTLQLTAATLYTNITPSTPVVSGRTMLSNGNYTLWTSGPVAQTIILADDTAARAYDVGDGDGKHPFRPRIYATFWSGDNSVSIRFSGGQDLSTESEDMAYGLTLSVGNVSPTQVSQLDLSGYGNAIGTGQTGLTAASAHTGNGALTVTGTLSGPALTVGHTYFFQDVNDSMWCQFTYTNSTTLTITDACQPFNGAFMGSVLPISIGDTLIVGNPKQAWNRTEWILPTGGNSSASQFWINGTAAPLQVNVVDGLAYLESTREVPNFDSTVTPQSSLVPNMYTSWSPGVNTDPYDGDWDGGSAALSTSVGNGGASIWLGIMPQWQTLWLYTGDWRMRQMSLGLADLSGAYPLSVRETDTTRKLVRGGAAGSGLGLPVSIQGRPKLQFAAQVINQILANGNGGCLVGGVTYSLQFCSSGTSDDLPVIPGSASINHGDMWVSMSADHQVASFFLPFVLSGDPFYLNLADMTESQIQASNVVGNGLVPSSRGPNGAYCVIVDEFRGEGWSMLNMAQVAWMSPDADPFTPWLVDCVNDRLATTEGELGITGTAYDGTTAKNWAAPLLDPESKSGQLPSALPAFTIPGLNAWCNDTDWTLTATEIEQEGQWLPYQAFGFVNPWMFGYVTLGFGRAHELGFAAGAIQSYMGAVYQAWATTPNAGYFYSMYAAPVEKYASAGGGFYPDWNTLINSVLTPQFLTGVGWNMNITSMTWNGTGGGQTVIATALPNAVLADGGNVVISGATNTGSGGNGAVNGLFPVVGVTDSTHFTVSMGGVASATTGNTNSNNHLTGIVSTTGVAVGSKVAGAGIPVNKIVGSVNMVASSVHLTGMNPGITPNLVVGTLALGPGIPPGTTVALLVSSTAVDLSAPVTATQNSVNVTFENNVTVTNIVSPSAVDISVSATTTTAGETLTFTNAVPGKFGTIGGTPTGSISTTNVGSAPQEWAAQLSAAEASRMAWPGGPNAMMTDNGVGAPWGEWFGQNVNIPINSSAVPWNQNPHWDIVPRTDANVLPAISTVTPP